MKELGPLRTALCIVFAAALSACGGGKSGETATISPTSAGASVGPVAAGAASVTVVALNLSSTNLATEGNAFTVTGTQVVQYGGGEKWVSKSVTGSVMCNSATFGADPAWTFDKVCKVATADVVPLVKEGETFTVSGKQNIQYGAGAVWVSKSVDTTGVCNNAFFGVDPVPNVAKSCQLTNTTVTTLAPEGGTFAVTGMQVVQFGVANSWVTKTVTGSGVCSSDFFGSNPAPGVPKACALAVMANAQTPLATEGGSFVVAGVQTLQYGAGDLWTSKTVSGTATCTAQFFGADPAPNTLKGCRLAKVAFASIVPGTVPPSPLLAPTIDNSKLVASVAGYNNMRVAPASVGDPSQNPVPADIGAFREYCEYSHMSYDDPIVYPGVAGKHLHTFMGNTGTDRNSTTQSISGSGNSTCAGGIANRTSYWFPSMIDTGSGTPIAPVGSLIYYKTGYNYIAPNLIKPFPVGLRMVAGSPGSTGPQWMASFSCTRADGTYAESQGIPTDCASGGTLLYGIAFPQCWDGVNLDSPDHQSHMAYPGFGCPADHPVALNNITFRINFPIGAEGTKNWRLSSDGYDRSLPGGYSAHADWFNGWEHDTMMTWVTRCSNASMDCHAFLIGDGRILY